MERELDLMEGHDASVLEVVDRLLNTGVVLAGDLAISVADIDLIYLRLQLMLSSVETAREAGWIGVSGRAAGRPALPAGADNPGAREG